MEMREPGNVVGWRVSVASGRVSGGFFAVWRPLGGAVYGLFAALGRWVRQPVPVLSRLARGLRFAVVLGRSVCGVVVVLVLFRRTVAKLIREAENLLRM